MRAARLTTYLIKLVLILLFPLVSQACLLFTGTLSNTKPPFLRARLIDNGVEICKINLRTSYGSTLPFTCLPGYKAWTDPDVRIVRFEKPGLFARYGFGNISRREWLFWEPAAYSESMMLLEASNYGCRDPERQLAEVRGF